MPQSKTISVLKKRSEFLAVAALRKKWVAPAFILQIAPRPALPDCTTPTKGLGLTASKKMIGNAVARNRARRRLRALAHEMLELHAATNTNYVFIARSDVLTRAYSDLRADLEKALKRLTLWQEAAL